MSGAEGVQSDRQGLRPPPRGRSQPPASSRNSLPGGTHPNNDAVVPLENGDEFVPTQNLGLVQGPESAEHLDATLVVGLGHGGRRRGAGARRERQGWCGLRRRELAGGRGEGQVLGLWGRPGAGWGAEPDAPLLSCGSGMRESRTPGWSSAGALPLRP